MFTGIIETTGQIRDLRHEGTNLHLTVESSISAELQVDQSVSHNGVCLTVVGLAPGRHTVTAVQETLNRTNLQAIGPNDLINLERCVPVGGRLDGHIVQGHVDLTALCTRVIPLQGSWIYRFSYEQKPMFMTVEKGSITVNGVSLTVVDSIDGEFSVTVIPYTYEHTNFRQLVPGSRVNLEFDIIGKYVAGILARQGFRN